MSIKITASKVDTGLERLIFDVISVENLLWNSKYSKYERKEGIQWNFDKQKILHQKMNF